MPFPPNSSSCLKKLSSEYQLYACGNFFGHSSILEKIDILGQPPSVNGILGQSSKGSRVLQGDSGKITGNNRSYRHENVTRVATLLWLLLS